MNSDRSGGSEQIYREMNTPDPTDMRALDENDGGTIGSLAGGGASIPSKHGESTLEFLQRTALDAQISSDKVLEIARKYPARVPYPNSALADSLSLVGRMIAGGLATRVYYVSQGGYDTHVNELPTHTRLMGELNDALVAFSQDLKAQGNFGRVMLMTFSEFGRRVAQNASNGTDHGAAAPMFVMGGAIRPGLFGQYPSLEALGDGDLTYNVDFRSVYATILDRWLRAPSAEVLGRQFPLLNLV
jgi:uncharacterized protein (DUF1501 family)